MSKPITILELNEPLEWRWRSPDSNQETAELLLPEGKGWEMPKMEWKLQVGHAWWITCSVEERLFPRDAIIEVVRHDDEWGEIRMQVRVVDVLGVETLDERGSVEETYGTRHLVERRYLRCVVVPA